MHEFEASEGGMRTMFDDIEAILTDDQFIRFREMRQLMQDWRDHGRQMWRAIRELPDAVEMTDEQRESFQAQLREQWQVMQEEMRLRWERGEGGMIWERPDFAALQDEFYGRGATPLDEDQHQLLENFRLQFVTEGPPVAQRPAEDVRKIIQAMQRLHGLSTEQRQELREIKRDALHAKDRLRGDQEQLAQLAADTKARIIAVLDPEQADELRQILDRSRPLRERTREGRTHQP